jgi:antitoxin component of MazEF toxin-antitoxin module
MTRLVIRKSGGADILSIPKAILRALHLQTGSEVELSLKENTIVLKPVQKETNLKDLLKGSPPERLVLKEDKIWLQEKPKGKEI